MSWFDTLVLAVALSIDAMIVSFSNGLIFSKRRTINYLKLALTVGFFQFLMPIIGYFFAQTVSTYVKPYAPWLVFGIFTFLGLKFIKDSFKENVIVKHNFTTGYIATVGIATSIDALFAGVSISFFGNSIFWSSLIIGVITFINSMLGFWCANLIKNLSSKKMQIFGGMILIFLGLKVLLTAIIYSY